MKTVEQMRAETFEMFKTLPYEDKLRAYVMLLVLRQKRESLQSHQPVAQ